MVAIRPESTTFTPSWAIAHLLCRGTVHMEISASTPTQWKHAVLRAWWSVACVGGATRVGGSCAHAGPALRWVLRRALRRCSCCRCQRIWGRRVITGGVRICCASVAQHRKAARLACIARATRCRSKAVVRRQRGVARRQEHARFEQRGWFEQVGVARRYARMWWAHLGDCMRQSSG